MRRYVWILLLCAGGLMMSGCKSTKTFGTPQQREVVSKRLGIALDKHDYLPFFQSATQWLGTPYRGGGMSRSGVDCSGFVVMFYREVFNLKLTRSSADIYDANCTRLSKRKLEPGDLVFFRTGSSRKINHVGIYLKDNKFIHSSSSRGVIVSDLDEPYYQNAWRNGGRVKLD